jgi:hypothetical protein
MLRACSRCGFLRPIDRKDPDFRLFWEPARENFDVCNAKIPEFEQALKIDFRAAAMLPIAQSAFLFYSNGGGYYG